MLVMKILWRNPCACTSEHTVGSIVQICTGLILFREYSALPSPLNDVAECRGTFNALMRYVFTTSLNTPVSASVSSPCIKEIRRSCLFPDVRRTAYAHVDTPWSRKAIALMPHHNKSTSFSRQKDYCYSTPKEGSISASQLSTLLLENTYMYVILCGTPWTI
nr:hypothetical protein CFP56_02652 [Quercus suber]